MSTLRFAPILTLQVGLVADDGDTLQPGPPVAPQQLPLSDLKGSVAYERIMESLPQLQQQWDAAQELIRI